MSGQGPYIHTSCPASNLRSFYRILVKLHQNVYGANIFITIDNQLHSKPKHYKICFLNCMWNLIHSPHLYRHPMATWQVKQWMTITYNPKRGVDMLVAQWKYYAPLCDAFFSCTTQLLQMPKHKHHSFYSGIHKQCCPQQLASCSCCCSKFHWGHTVTRHEHNKVECIAPQERC